MRCISAEILQINLGTSAHPVDGLSILCRATNPLGEIQVIYLGNQYDAGPWLGPVGMLNLVGVATCYTITEAGGD